MSLLIEKYVCCFCNKTINQKVSELITLQIPLHGDAGQALFAHAFCFRLVLHPDAPFIFDSEILIYISLLDEGTDIWRPVRAIPLDKEIFIICPEQSIPSSEKWSFQPGQVIRCTDHQFSDGKIGLIAIESLPHHIVD